MNNDLNLSLNKVNIIMKNSLNFSFNKANMDS